MLLKNVKFEVVIWGWFEGDLTLFDPFWPWFDLDLTLIWPLRTHLNARSRASQEPDPEPAQSQPKTVQNAQNGTFVAHFTRFVNGTRSALFRHFLSSTPVNANLTGDPVYVLVVKWGGSGCKMTSKRLKMAQKVLTFMPKCVIKTAKTRIFSALCENYDIIPVFLSSLGSIRIPSPHFPAYSTLPSFTDYSTFDRPLL